MLFHVTMTHTEDNCPLYHKEMIPKMIEASEHLEELGKALNVKLHYFTVCAPEHVIFGLLEADSLSAISRYVFSLPLQQQMKIVPVENMQDTMAMAKAAMAQAQD